MKIFFMLNILFLGFQPSAFASNNCSLSHIYKSKGWIVHDSSEFLRIEKNVLQHLKEGLEKNSIVYDLSGLIITNQTPNGEHEILNATMYDDLETVKDEMYGDIALLELHNQPGVIAEIRWYVGGFKQVVFNSNFLTCISEAPPFAENSVL